MCFETAAAFPGTPEYMPSIIVKLKTTPQFVTSFLSELQYFQKRY
jgi:hypothetical protein